jgi:hypothetical protein
MRRLTSEVLLTGLALALVAAHGCGGPETYGESVTVNGTTAVADILKNPAAYEGQTVKVKGTIATECPSGCWFELNDGGAPIHVDLSPGGLAIPQKVGKQVVVVGRVVVKDGRPEIHGKGVEIH